MSKRPKPIALSPSEGAFWEPWKKWGLSKEHNVGSAHAILFEDGTVFDTINGWRGKRHKYTPEQIEILLATDVS